MELTQQQLQFFATFGYLAFPGLFANEVDNITESFERIWLDNGGGHAGQPHDGQQRSALVQFIDQDEFLSSLIDDPRIDRTCAAILGEDYNYAGSDGNFYVGDTKLHSDGYLKSKYTSFKMAFYLDPVSADTGCLRVIPGSHKYGDVFADSLEQVKELRETSENPSDDLWGINGSDVPSIPLEVVPGDLVMFNHRIKHSSWGGGPRRRMFTINFEQRFGHEDVEELKQRMGRETRFWIERQYGDVMMKTASASRRVHLEQRMANDGHMAELAKKARDDMSEPSRG